jgi:hypothetical protein
VKAVATVAESDAVPHFVNVGPGRCGTSWLHEALTAHPDIGMSRVKETEFFNNNFDMGSEWYLSHFTAASGKKMVGEVSNMYYLDTAIPDRLHSFNPGIKVIFNVRDPLALLRSYHLFGVRRGLALNYDPSDLDMPVGLFMGSGYANRERRGRLTDSDKPSLVESVLLSRYLRPYLERFPPDQLYIFDFERFKRQPDAELHRIYSFLGVDPDYQLGKGDERVNEAIRPRFDIIGRLATRGAFLLRRAGAYGLLTRLHGSRMLKAMLFQAVPPGDADTVLSIPPEVQRLLAEERGRIAALHPDIEASWKQAGLI